MYKDYEYYGAHKITNKNWIFRVFAPAAESVDLVGDFNHWTPAPMTLNDEGIWELTHTATSGQKY
jgi:1,4-alpha-glucan branching enzyme